MIEALIALILATYQPPTIVLGSLADTGMGKCKMDQHWHNEDSRCHRDSDDSPLRALPTVTIHDMHIE